MRNYFKETIYEKIFLGKVAICQITFGTEPIDYEICDFCSENITVDVWNRLQQLM